MSTDTNLSTVIVPSKVRRVWKDTIRDGLRNQETPDLHDCLDLHLNIERRIEKVRLDVLDGTYLPVPSEIVRLEKDHGISRRLRLLAPIDALLLQTACEVLEPLVKARQSSTNSFYSRSHDHRKIEDFEGNFGYPWWALWPSFQKKIWGFLSVSPVVVCTDIANYFDSIPLKLLRNRLADFGQIDPAFLDFLFFVLNSYVWKPRYSPNLGVGLPQLNFDAPRLLAHAYLFEVDELLSKLCEQNFARWMDDMTFGVRSKTEAKKVLGRLDDLLNRLGLRLNLKKTAILEGTEIEEYFWLRENMLLNVMTNIIRTTPDEQHRALRRLAKKRFTKFSQKGDFGQKSKVTKRYWSLFSKLSDPILEEQSLTTLENIPALREHVFRYFRALGFSESRGKIIFDFVAGGHCVDDVAGFMASQLVVEWEIPLDSQFRDSFVKHAAERSCRRREDAVRLSSSLWVLAKYGGPETLHKFISQSEGCWRKSDWGARQVAATTPALSRQQSKDINTVIQQNGLLEGLSVIEHLEALAGSSSLTRQMNSYLTHEPKKPYGYPLYKVLILRAIANGNLQSARKARLLEEVQSFLSDPVYLRILSDIQ